MHIWQSVMRTHDQFSFVFKVKEIWFTLGNILVPFGSEVSFEELFILCHFLSHLLSYLINVHTYLVMLNIILVKVQSCFPSKDKSI